jgi:hypothetical protein
MFATHARRQLTWVRSFGQDRPAHLLCRFNQPGASSQWLSSSSSRASNTVSSDEEKQTQLLLQEIKDANDKYDGRVAIQSVDERGWGLCALTTFQQGDLVMRGTALEQSAVRTKHSVQLDWNLHAEMDLPARFVNHVCNQANVGVRPNAFGAYDFYALRQIDKDQELLWDYETTEHQVLEGFSCSCGSSTCRGELKGFQAHKEQVIESYGEGYIAPYLLVADERKE